MMIVDQVGFYKVVVLPMVKAFAAHAPLVASIHDSAVANYNYWLSRVDTFSTQS
jgi:hypothetical protein